MFFAFSLHVSAGGRILLFISGAASLILAVLAFRHFGEGYAVLLLAIWIGIGFIFRGVATAVSAISDPTLPGRGWEIFFGIISLIAGIVMLAWPGLSLLSLLTVVGVWLIVIGVVRDRLRVRHPEATTKRPNLVTADKMRGPSRWWCTRRRTTTLRSS